MKVAIISDIHGNYVSLKAVLADIDQQDVDDIICLGDIATLGPQPAEVVAELRKLGCQTVLGNHETYLFNLDLGRAYMDSNWFMNALQWCHDRLSNADLNYMKSFKPIMKFRLDMGTVLLCFHGSPRSYEENIFASTPPSELDQMLDGYEATIMVGGHTHVQMIRQHKGTLIVNTGSVGMPFEQMPFVDAPTVMPWAEYAILNWNKGNLGVELRRIPIDLNELRQVVIESKMPETSDWIHNWVTLPEVAATGKLISKRTDHFIKK
ncbi:MAG: metallophosphoesterase family protein [Chloroflexota bacterium]